MKAVILGAGASFDAFYSYFNDRKSFEWRPPLANEVFTPRENFRDIFRSYPGAMAYLSRVNAYENLEDFFQQEWEFIRNNRSEEKAAQFINLKFCLAHLFHAISSQNRDVGLSNYDILIQKAQEYQVATGEEVMFITFNYDLLLEDAFRKAYLPSQRNNLNTSEYLESPVKIIKPHGSCNWFSKVNPEVAKIKGKSGYHSSYRELTFSSFLYDTRVSLVDLEGKHVSEEYEALDNSNNPYTASDMYDDKRVYYYPRLLVPMKDKDDFIMPEDQKEYLNNNLSKVDEILVIGWKGAEEAFQRLLNDHLGDKKIQVDVVNIGDASIEAQLRTTLPKAEFDHFKEANHYKRRDNTLLFDQNAHYYVDNRNLPGSFSSYALHLVEGKYHHFFSY